MKHYIKNQRHQEQEEIVLMVTQSDYLAELHVHRELECF